MRYAEPKEKKNMDNMVYAVVRTEAAGVFIGAVEEDYKGKTTLEVFNARRLWYWSGAASLSQLAMEGVKDPDNCKFPAEVPSVTLNGVIEVIEATKEAKESVDAVQVWKK